MKIFNLHSNKTRNIKNLKRTSHKEYDENGEMKKNQYVEFTVIGNNGEWKDFMSVADFKKLNPKINITNI